MPLPRYERELDETASPRFRRAYLKLFLWVLLLGVCAGVGWVLTLLLTT
jgi:hypothetical protein